MSDPRTARRSAPLPYRPIAGVEPCPGGWLVVGGRLQGATLAPMEPFVVGKFTEVLDYKPAFEVLALHAPVGLPEKPIPGGRDCDREARQLLGWPRSSAIVSPAARSILHARNPVAAANRAGVGLSPVAEVLLPRFAEVDEEIQPYWQRTVFEANPELSFFQLNGDNPLRWSKRTPDGVEERHDLLANRLPGVDRTLHFRTRGAQARHRMDGAVLLWTARRIAGRATVRIPEIPQWDERGLRMELLR